MYITSSFEDLLKNYTKVYIDFYLAWPSYIS